MIQVAWHASSLHSVTLLDTYKLARAVLDNPSYRLTNLLATLDLTAAVNTTVPDGQPHRAFWDTAGTALLLGALISIRWQTDPAMAELTAIAGIPLDNDAPTVAHDDQLHLF